MLPVTTPTGAQSAKESFQVVTGLSRRTLAANTRLEGMDAVDVVFSRLFGGPSDWIDK